MPYKTFSWISPCERLIRSRKSTTAPRISNQNGYIDYSKIHPFENILDAAVDSLLVAGENVDVVEMFTYLGSVLHRSMLCEAEVKRRLGLAMRAMKALDKSVRRSKYLSRRTKVRVFGSLVMPVLIYFVYSGTASKTVCTPMPDLT